MNAFKFRFLFVFLCTLLFSSCKKDETDDGLPKPTQTGEDMMAARVDGNIWIRKTCWCYMGNNGIATQFENGWLNIEGKQDEEYISITLSGVDKPGNYPFKPSYNKLNGNGSYWNSGTLTSWSEINRHITNYTHSGSVTITKFDTANKIISGKFTFDAESEYDPKSIVHITNGWFDVKYR